MAFKDAAETLAESLASIDNQTYPDIDVVLIDDASSDAGSRIAQEWSRSRPGVRLVRSERHLGVGGALALGQSLVSGEFIARIDADDESHPERITRQVAAMVADPTFVAIGTRQTVGDFGDQKGGGRLIDVSPALTEGRNDPIHPSMLIRTAPFLRVGGYRSKFRRAQDYDLWLRLCEVGRIGILDAVLLRRGQSHRQVTRQLYPEGFFNHAMALASRNEVRAGRADPVEAWDGEIDLAFLLRTDTRPLHPARVLLLVAHASQQDRRTTATFGDAMSRLARTSIADLAQIEERMLLSVAVRHIGRGEIAARARLVIAAAISALGGIRGSLRERVPQGRRG